MFAAPEARGRGVGHAVLRELEARAQALGVGRLVLETGIHQHDAIRLYERAGYERTSCWGDYAGSATSVCYHKLVAKD